jgi:hypothetical protein
MTAVLAPLLGGVKVTLALPVKPPATLEQYAMKV